MPEDVKNLGAINASTTAYYDLTDRTVFPVAAFLDIRRIKIPNNSGSNITVNVNGRDYPINRGAPASITPGGRIYQFSITTDGVAVSSGELRAVLQGDINPTLGSA